MEFDDLNNERRALYGFQYGFKDYKGWFNALFQPYSLYPYLNLLREETRELLYKKTLFKKLVPVFSKSLKISSFVNNLIGVDLVKDRKTGIGFIEELAQVILEEIESRQGLEEKIGNVEKKLIKNQRYFSGLSYSIHNHEDHPKLKARDKSAAGKLIAVEGILNNLDEIASYNPALYASHQGSGINWILSDFPYFSMRADNPSYDGNVLGLRLEQDVEELISQCVPFKKELGWYPYVIVFGFLQNSLSPKYSNIKIVDWSWMQFRLPRSFDEIHPLLNSVLNDQKNRANAFKPCIDREHRYDIFLYLSAIQLAYVNQQGHILNINY